MHSSSETADLRSSPSLISLTGFLYFPLALVARLPFAMMVIGVLTLVVSARGSVELGGWNSAAVGLGVACFGPFIGAASDRFGQRSVLLIAGALNSLVLVFLSWAAFSSIPIWVVFVASFLAGATVPQISPLSRTRLVTIIQSEIQPRRRPKLLSTVLAYESAADEIIFVFGPVAVGILASTMGAWAPVTGAAILTLLFVTAFALHRTGRAPRAADGSRPAVAPAAELRSPVVLVTVAGILCVGLFFGSMLTSLTAYMRDRGETEQAGLLYGIMGVGSAIFALGVAIVPPAFTLRYRWPVFAALIVAGGVLLQLAPGLMGVLASLALMGFGIGPLLVTLYSFGALRSPAGRSATLMTMLGSGLMVGQSAAAAITGTVADHVGTDAALMLPLGAAALALATGFVNWFLTPAGREPIMRTGPIPRP